MSPPGSNPSPSACDAKDIAMTYHRATSVIYLQVIRCILWSVETVVYFSRNYSLVTFGSKLEGCGWTADILLHRPSQNMIAYSTHAICSYGYDSTFIRMAYMHRNITSYYSERYMDFNSCWAYLYCILHTLEKPGLIFWKTI